MMLLRHVETGLSGGHMLRRASAGRAGGYRCGRVIEEHRAADGLFKVLYAFDASELAGAAALPDSAAPSEACLAAQRVPRGVAAAALSDWLLGAQPRRSRSALHARS